YRRYGGKKPCLQRIYGQALVELDQEIARPRSLAQLATALAADPERALLLVIGASYLPMGTEVEAGVATQESLPGLVEEIVRGNSSGLDAFEQGIVAGAVLEVVRSAVVA